MGEGSTGRGAVTATWAAHCGDLWRAHVLSSTGRDICNIVGPSPRRPAEWAAMMRRLGVRTMDGVLSAVHGAPIPRRQAMRGDMVRRSWAIGICRGDKAEFIGGEMVSMRDVDAAWRLEACCDPTLQTVSPVLSGKAEHEK